MKTTKCLDILSVALVMTILVTRWCTADKPRDNLADPQSVPLTTPPTASEQGAAEEASQHEDDEFLHQLFDKYGDDEGRLSYGGLTKLMESIGLGGGHSGDDYDVPGIQRTEADTSGGGDLGPVSPPSGDGEDETSVLAWEEGAVTETTIKSIEDTTDERPEAYGNAGSKQDAHLSQCLSPDSVLSIFEIPMSRGLSQNQFVKLCPVLLQQLDSHRCVTFNINGHPDGDHSDHPDNDHQYDHSTELNDHDHDHTATNGHRDTNGTTTGDVGYVLAEIWGYSIASITLISLSSIACILIVPCMQRYPGVYNHLLSFLVAMAVGTLSGDAMMHLIPHSLGIHLHDDKPTGATEDEEHAHEAIDDEKAHAANAVWKGFFVLVGIFLFFIVEQIMGMCQRPRRNKKAKRKRLSNNDDDHNSNRSRDNDPSNQDVELSGEYKSLNGSEVVGEKLCHHCVAGNSAGRPNSRILRNSMLLMTSLEKTDNPEQTSTSHHHHSNDNHHHHNCHDDEADDPTTSHNHAGHSHDIPSMGDNSIATMVWIVVMGDGLHNFCDGLIVGAAFADSIAGGLSTSIAVMCHEIPHELGDFAVMLKGGMSVRQALLVQLVSSVLAFLGLAIGITVGNVDSLSMWVFALAGGMFIYIALVDLFPEMLSTLGGKSGAKVQMLILQGMGTSLGVGIMLLIGLQEDWLREKLGG